VPQNARTVIQMHYRLSNLTQLMNQRVQVSGVCIISQRVCTYVLRDQECGHIHIHNFTQLMNQRVQVSGVCIISQRVCTYVLRDQECGHIHIHNFT
jgi:hypothetical protein